MGLATRVANTVLMGAALVLAGSAAAKDGVRNMVHEMVKVESRDGKVLVRLTIHNQSEQTIYVPRSVASEKELFGNYFEVRDSSNGDPVNYIGPMVKRGPLGKEDFLAVKLLEPLLQVSIRRTRPPRTRKSSTRPRRRAGSVNIGHKPHAPCGTHSKRVVGG